MKYIVLLVVFVAVIGSLVGGVLYRESHTSTLSKKSTTQKKPDIITDSLVISPQVTKRSVFVNSATLSKNGFVVVREIEVNQLSQIVQMSDPLKMGVNKDITINLGTYDATNKDLVIMIYDDYGNDGIFNDLDMPALTKEGYMIASYIKTGKPLPTTITETDSSGISMPGMKAMAIVRYSGTKFTPDKVEVSAGDMVEFVDDGPKDMWVASDPHPQHSTLPTFDQFRPYKTGAIYRYVFQKTGKWYYHDHLNASVGGVVIVH